MPGLDRAVVEILFTFTAIITAILVLTLSSVVGIFRAIRRRRRGRRSRSAIALALMAALTSSIWLLFWTAHNIYHRDNPIDGLLAINLALCVLPFSWLLAALRAHTSSH
jgi:hypothetical protein